ncbi:MAG: DnaK suppressor protein [Gammaproteobacteria bacterium]|jgi:DnaK suppressor protein|nr:DnaK suppressor protein [Gammaproteobacteria bacterium]
MATKAHPLDPAFVEKQRQTLLKLRASLLTAAKDDEADEADIKDEGSGGAREFEDDAQKLATLELEGNLVVRDIARLERVDRALRKIEEGTYGASDQSGQLIARERLEAIPESIYTLAEEQAREQAH